MPGKSGRTAVMDAYPRRGFWGLFATQFQGAFNDNLFQYIIIYFLLEAHYAVDGVAGAAEISLFGLTFKSGDFVPNAATVLFSLPFILFPSFFGALADRLSKGTVAQYTKYLEIVIMILGGVAFYVAHVPALWVVLFLMATQSTMFSPAKYGLLPEMLPESRLSWGNGILQMGTVVSIIVGVGIAGPVFEWCRGAPYKASVILTGLSVVGTLTALLITRPPAANPQQRIPLMPWSGMGRYLRVIWSDSVLLNVTIGYTYFWFAGTLSRNAITTYSLTVMDYSATRNSILLAAVALGIGAGALVAGYLSRGKIEQGFILIGAVGMAVTGVLVSIPKAVIESTLVPAVAAVVLPLVGGADGAVGGTLVQAGGYFLFLTAAATALGAFAGVFDVPLAATLQQRAPRQMKGGIIAATNMLTFVGMAAAGGLLLGLRRIGLTPLQVFFILGMVSLGMGVYIAWRIPLLVLRALLWPLDGILFRLMVTGRNQLPEAGPALLVADHDSLIDTLPLQMATEREVVVVLERRGLEHAWVRRLGKCLHLLPVDTSTEEGLHEAEAAVRRMLAEGWIVCVSRERQLHADGLEVPWFRDYHALAAEAGAPVIPVSITRLWERVYIFRDNRLQWRWWGRLRYPVQVAFGAPLPAGTPAVAVRHAVGVEGMEAYLHRPYAYRLLQHGFVRMARRRLRFMATADGLSGELSYFKALVGAIVFARKLRKILGPGEMVGLLVPSTVGGALANIAVQMLGKIPVNLNYTATSETIASCARRCGITHTLTSRKFLERLPLDVPGTPVYLEDIRESVTGRDRVIGMLLALFAPVHLLDRILGAARRTDEDLATVIFSSGSEGEPKGVMLTQRNVMTLVESAQEVFPHNWNSCVVGFLPLFHSFGYAVCLWTPLLAGIRSVFHPNPLEPKAIGNLIEKHGGSIMVCTATFLQGFIRRCEPGQLKSLDFVVGGAEKLPARVRDAFNEKFGIVPVEGYGTTECAPGVSVNSPDCPSPGFFVRNLKHGSIGRPMTGQAVRVADPDTGADLPAGEAGELLVKGPNVMKGYLADPERTAKVLRDGWYATGDIAALDDEGFITITDRIARFSKIAGEMVPHTRVEESLHALLGLTEQSLVVAGVPDTAKGERLVVLHILEDAQLDELLEKLDASDLPNLWKPKANNFYRIEAIPVLGTGKMDIKQAKRMAQALDLGE
ncbi:MAG: MFS transporter [Candidatus Hydrogenedentes bacterium]|nr:MFS transporter [Candidatus Hydrogenedentota bacterium]